MSGKKGMRWTEGSKIRANGKRRRRKGFITGMGVDPERQDSIVKGMALSHFQAEARYRANPIKPGTYRASNGVTLPLTKIQQETPDPA